MLLKPNKMTSKVFLKIIFITLVFFMGMQCQVSTSSHQMATNFHNLSSSESMLPGKKTPTLYIYEKNNGTSSSLFFSNSLSPLSNYSSLSSFAATNSSHLVPSTLPLATSISLVTSSVLFVSSVGPNATASHTEVTSVYPSSASSIIVSSSQLPPTSTPKPQVIVECGEECKTLKKRLYVAAVFAVTFVVVAIVLGILLYRQYKISSEYRNDPSLSRLI